MDEGLSMNAQNTRETGQGKLGRVLRGRRDAEPGEGHGTVHKALHDIQYIRDIIEMSQDFFVSGWSGVAAGIITTAGAAVSAWIISQPERWEIPRTLWVLWIVIGLLLALTDIVFFIRSSRRAARPVFSMLLVKVVLIETIITAQGIVLTLAFTRIGAPEYIPGTWLLAFGTTLTAVGLYFPGGLWVLGLTVFLASVAAFVVPSGGLWCVGFAGAAMCLWGAAYLISRGK
jgi:hypothetical protein